MGEGTLPEEELMMKKSSAILTVVLALGLCSGTALADTVSGKGTAETSVNGLSLNRLAFNGLSFNRLAFNGLSFNRLALNQLNPGRLTDPKLVEKNGDTLKALRDLGRSALAK